MVCLPGTSVSSIRAKPQHGRSLSGVSELRDLFMVPHCVAQMLGTGILRVVQFAFRDHGNRTGWFVTVGKKRHVCSQSQKAVSRSRTLAC